MHLFKPKVLIVGHMDEADFQIRDGALDPNVDWELLLRPDLVGEDITDCVREFQPDIIGVQRSPITSQVLDASDELKIVVSLGSGYGNIDRAHAHQKRIKVARCPGGNAYAVAELALGLMINLDRLIPKYHENVQAGNDDPIALGLPTGLHGRTIGILGLGHVGECVARAAMTLGMKVSAWSRNRRSLSRVAFVLEENRLSGPLHEGALELARSCNIICVCLAETENTVGICDKTFFDEMQENSIFINTARHRLVDEAALIEALDSGRNIRAGLDVYDPDGDPRLREHPNAILTPHIGAKTRNAKTSTAEIFCRTANLFVTNGEAISEVPYTTG